MKLHKFRSNGKLMISGEYLVIKGATAFAVPLKKGNTLTVKEKKDSKEFLHWNTFSMEKLWNTYIFEPLKNFEILEATDLQSAEFLQKLLLSATKIKPDFKYETISKQIDCYIEFNMNWGLGSSATTISNVAYWADINPFTLNSLISKGSGYDIACARSNKPILYSKSNGYPNILEVEFSPPFLNNIYFIYLGKKQSTEKSIFDFLSNTESYSEFLVKISRISEEFVNCNDINKSISLIEEHEWFISKILGERPIKTELFPEFLGAIKSLGAWGGDFAMAISNQSSDYIYSYFFAKGFDTIFKYTELVL